MTKILLTLLLCVPARAERMVREGTQSTQNSIFVSSLTSQVTMSGSLVVNSSGTFGSSVTASAFFGDGSHLSGVSGSWNGGIVTNPSTFTATVDVSTLIITGVYGLPTRQVFTSGSSVYYSTASTGAMPRQLRIRMVGGGGGGGAGSTNNGVGGSSTTFNSISASSGTGGTAGSAGSNSPGGIGGSNGAGSASIRIAGGGGGWGTVSGNFDAAISGAGGVSAFGGAAGSVNGDIANAPGLSAAANSGSGGSGGATNATDGGGGGGGAGEYVEMIINSPASSYTYRVGTGGAGGATVVAGGNGAAGIIIVDEYY